MKYIRYTYTDAHTKIPLSQEVARNGIMICGEIRFLFDIRSSRSQQAPILYGVADDDFVVLPWMQEIEEDHLISLYKQELKNRGRDKRKGKVSSFLSSKGFKSREALTSLLLSLEYQPITYEIDFEVFPCQWERMSKLFLSETLREFLEFEQECFSECRNLHEEIDNLPNNIEEIRKWSSENGLE